MSGDELAVSNSEAYFELMKQEIEAAYQSLPEAPGGVSVIIGSSTFFIASLGIIHPMMYSNYPEFQLAVSTMLWAKYLSSFTVDDIEPGADLREALEDFCKMLKASGHLGGAAVYYMISATSAIIGNETMLGDNTDAMDTEII